MIDTWGWYGILMYFIFIGFLIYIGRRNNRDRNGNTMNKIFCFIFGHRWKDETFISKGTEMNGYAVVECCSRCRKYNLYRRK